MATATVRVYQEAGLLWSIGGGSAEVLRDCPPLERLKFAVLAGLNVMLAVVAALIAWFVCGGFLGRIGLVDPYLLLHSLLSVLGFFIALGLLIATVRTSARGTKVAMASGLMMATLRTSLDPLSALVPGALLGGVLGALMSNALKPQEATDAYFLMALPAVLFASPAILARLWSSPVYDYLNSGAQKTKDIGFGSWMGSVISAPEPSPAISVTGVTAPTAVPASAASSDALAEQEKQLRVLFTNYPDSLQLGEQLIKVQRELALYDDALVVYEALIERNPRNVHMLRAKSQVYREKGDEERYRKTLEEADRLEASLSFEVNLGKVITLRRFGASDVEFFADFEWPLQPSVNILLGRNGYGKTYLLRALVALLQDDEAMTRPFVENGGARARLQMSIDREGTTLDAVRSKLLFERRFGKVPVLAIPDMRYVDKSRSTVGSASDEVYDLKSQGADNFLREESYQGLITNFLYGLCLDQLDPEHRPDRTLIALVEKSVASLSGARFEFHEFKRKDNARFEILVYTEGSGGPMPIQKASQGTLSVVAMVGLIYRYLQSLYPNAATADIQKQRAIVVIDEIDAHLHPSWQQKILQLFRKSFPNVQFIVTAHSPLVVAGARGGEVAVLAPADGRFKVGIVERHFIGATFEDVYTTIFGVERVDATFKSLGTQIANKSGVETKIRQLEGRKKRTAEEDDTLADLREQLYYLRVYEEQQELQDRRARQDSESQTLTRQNMELKSRIEELTRELSRAVTGAKALTEEPTERTRSFFGELLAREPANAKIVAQYVGALIDDGWPAVANAALDAMTGLPVNDVEVLKRMAVGYERLERYREARAALESAVKFNPNEPGLQAALDRLDKLG